MFGMLARIKGLNNMQFIKILILYNVWYDIELDIIL